MHKEKKQRRLVLILSSFVVLMFGFGYAMVPLYNVLCKQLGINGKTGGQVVLDDTGIDESRIITVQFLATTNAYIPWEFRPRLRTIKMHPGENKAVTYFAKNNTDHAMTVQAIPSVTPSAAAKYLKKTECFCFTQQKMNGQEEMDWPLLFHIDKSVPKNIHTITLAYTLFDVTSSHSTVIDAKQGHL
ncbi:MAG: cytochrome c oxidase assembly protein [Gammaproteobacteria bacterium]|nr:cytochrome c oxidase assembly protein [Gammaproteobacteria bacterium]